MISPGNVQRKSSLTSSLHSDGVSTHSPSIRAKSVDDGELYVAGQALVPVVNNPATIHRSNSGSYGILSWPASAVDKAWAEAAPPPPSGVHREVWYSDFDDYRSRVGTLMDRYMHKRMSVQQDNARRLSVADPEGCGYLRGEGLVQALRQVPSLYFQEDFALTRPETFTQVIRGETPEERNATLETLNSSLDIVETELLNEIAARSDSFFEAAESLQELQQSMGDTLFQIQRLQIHAHNIDNGMCSRAEHVQSLHRERSNLEKTLELLKTIETVTHAQDAVNLLLLAHDYPSALDLIDSLKLQYEDVSSSGVLRSGIEKLSCLKSAPDALEASVVSLKACLIGELLEMLNWDEGQSVLRSVAAKALGEEGRIRTSMGTESEASHPGKKEKIKQIFVGLSRTGSVAGAFSEIIPHAVSRLTASLRNVTEILLPNFVQISMNDGESAQDVSQSDHLLLISHQMFLSLLNACFAVASACVTHYKQLGELLLEVTDDGSILQHRATVEKGRLDLCQALVHTCHSHWMQMFQTRAQIHQRLPLAQLQELVEVNNRCSGLAATVNAKCSQKLGSLLQASCKSALEAMHRERKTRLQSALEQETWKLCTVDSIVQDAVTRIFSDGQQPEQSSEGESQVLCLGATQYRVVRVVLYLSAMICEAVQQHKNFPEFVTDSGRHVVELLTIFNKRSCQLVLGAQAMQVSGLKSITAKHLALCSQSILFFIHLHGDLTREVLDGCPQAKRTILQPEFDRLKQDLITHLDGIHSKLIGIMKERVVAGIEQLREEMKPCPGKEDEDVPPSLATQQIAKQLRILTQVLTPILHTTQMTEICTKVAKIFSEGLGNAFRRIIDEYDIPLGAALIDDQPVAVETTESCLHPLGESNKPANTPSCQTPETARLKQRLMTDCQLLVEILSKLPIDENDEEVLEPLRQRL